MTTTYSDLWFILLNFSFDCSEMSRISFRIILLRLMLWLFFIVLMSSFFLELKHFSVKERCYSYVFFFISHQLGHSHSYCSTSKTEVLSVAVSSERKQNIFCRLSDRSWIYLTNNDTPQMHNLINTCHEIKISRKKTYCSPHSIIA